MEAFYLAGRQRQRFCLYHPPQGLQCRGGVVAVHAFAEEMNRSRRMSALQARAFAAAGFGVLQLDLQGCGDSSGDFGEARWPNWIEDVLDACDWLGQRHPRLWLWGTRAGCLIAADAAAQRPDLAGMLLWQPVIAGRQYLRQFLRLRLASDMLGGGRVSIETLETALAAGNMIEIAGYALSAELAAGLAASNLNLPAGLMHCVCLEVSSREEKSLLPATAAWAESARALAPDVRAVVVEGPAFWQTADVMEAPALIAASVEALVECSS